MFSAIKVVLVLLAIFYALSAFESWEYKLRGIEERPKPPVYHDGVSAQYLMIHNATPQEIVKACNAKEERGIKDEFCDDLANGKIK